MRLGRFTRRAALRAAVSAASAAPLGREGALAAAVCGAAQEQPAAGILLGVPTIGVLARRRGPVVPRRRWVRTLAGVAIGVATRWVWPVAAKQPAAVAPHRACVDLAATLDGAGVGIVINVGAGPGRSGSRHPGDEVREALPAADVVVLEDADGLPDALERMAGSGVRVLGIAGGDGSINTAAEVALRHRLPLVVVPAGTLNHMARDSGVETVGDAVEALRAGTAIEIDVARIGARPFLNTASFGSYVEIVDAREALEGRIGKWLALAVAVVRVLRHGRPVDVEIDGHRERVWTAFVGNCRYLPEGMAPTWRERLDDGQLDVRIADASHPLGRTRLVLAVLTGRMHRSRVFRSWSTTNLTVRRADGPLRLARDGETFDGTDHVEIAKKGERLVVYAPRPAEPSAGAHTSR
jgi:diacylglycerol kinase family enzyme